MFRLGSFDILELVARVLAVILAVSIHEMAHGYAAYFLGDKTAKAMGRLSMNPLRHLDPVGSLCLLFFGFGWAKPVMVNPYYFKKPKRDMALVSLAGPLSNFLMAYIGLLLLKLLVTFTVPINAFVQFIILFINMFVMLNVGLGVFNLLPIPPLDGSKIFLSLLPPKLYYDIMRYEHLGWLILVIALSLDVLDPIIGGLGSLILRALFFLAGLG